MALTLLVPIAASLICITTARARDMSFQFLQPRNCRTECAPLLLAKGRITSDTYRSFLTVASRYPRGISVRLDSPGGTLFGGIMLGLALRERGAMVTVARGTTCASACAYAFLGGVRRKVSSGARLGVHRFYMDDNTLRAMPTRRRTAVTRQANLTLRGYIVAMGAHPELVQFAARVDPSRMHYMSRRELRAYGVTTVAAPKRRDKARVRPSRRRATRASRARQRAHARRSRPRRARRRRINGR